MVDRFRRIPKCQIPPSAALRRLGRMSVDYLETFIQGFSIAKKVMDKLDEHTWKWRFVERLAELLVKNGLSARAAVANAHAQSHDYYPRRKDGDPKSEAEIAYRELKADTF